MNQLTKLSLVILLFVSACKKQAIYKSPDLNTAKVDTILVNSNVVTEKADSLKTPEGTITPKTDDLESDRVNIDEVDFKYLKGKAKVGIKSTEVNQTVNVDIRVKKDSLIWLNVSVPGLPVSIATAVFTKDSVKLYNKYEGNYNEYPYELFSEKFKFNLNFDILQALIVGNRPFKKNKSRVIRENEYFLLKQHEGKVQIDNYIGQDKKLKKLLMTQEVTNTKLSMDFNDFTTLNNYVFPLSNLVTVEYKSEKDQKVYQTVINIKHTKVELLDEPLQFPFKVPEKLLQKKN
ncbi:DUF4292 domain-containing protein [Flectobacillus major]|jgi:hypothetical protein|uniref:DUF4292 domain-containing protein n=1 Tax=Flectobacillus major TaxID=103 RepID=UPI0004172325|nr:DUF4292 domain-containing protein [Flectobacillus major]